MSNRRVLIISPHFPPVNAPDMQRVRMSAPYYSRKGWEPTVLTIHPDDVAASREAELTLTCPPALRVITCHAWSLRWSTFFGTRTLGLRAWLPLLVAGSRLLREGKIYLVFFSDTHVVTVTLWRPS